MKFIGVLLCLALAPAITAADTVSTFPILVTYATGMAFNASGYLYVVQRQPGNAVCRISPSGQVGSMYGFNDPVNLVISASGEKFVTNFLGGKISRISVAEDVSDFVTGLSNPYGITIDPAGNFYVTEYYNQSVKKITPAGVITTIATNVGPANLRATSITREPSGDLLVGTNTGTAITRVKLDGTQSLFAESVLGIEALVAGPDGNWYATSRWTGQILRFTPEGVRSLAAGTGGGGNLDGPAATATFGRPFGLALSADGRLFISDNVSQRIRILTIDLPAVPVATCTWGEVKGRYRGSE